MPAGIRHRWDLSPKEAVALQRELAESVVFCPLPEDFKILGASDIGYVPAIDRLVAVVVTFSWPELQLLETVHAISSIPFPYIPGLLSFREVPPLLEAFEKLRNPPDALLCDGQGIAHPRRLGLASHLGLWLDIPTVGCAKSRLCGTHDPPGPLRGDSALLRHQDEIVGVVFRSRDNVNPIYISPGHLADLPGSVELVRRCLGRTRIPEPLRQAHNIATRLRNGLAEKSATHPA